MGPPRRVLDKDTLDGAGTRQVRLKIAKSEIQPGYLLISNDNISIWPEERRPNALVKLRPADPEFFNQLRQLIMEHTT